MGKVQTPKRNSASASSPYPKKNSSKPAVRNNIFKFNTNIGQHILKNPGIADAIVDKAHIQPADTVLEVGPGTGVLTGRILQKARNVVAVELDPRMAAEITRRFQETPSQKKLRVILGDFIKVDSAELPPFDICISNTPYQISSALVFKLLALPTPPRVSILMVQREFALRLLARPGDSMYSRLSVNAQFFARVSHIMKVGRKNFTPPPQVESSVVRLEPRSGRPDISWAEFDGLLRICFVRKNKTMRASWTGRQVLEMLERNWVTWAAMYPEEVQAGDYDFLRSDETAEEVTTTMDGEQMDEDDNDAGELDEFHEEMDLVFDQPRPAQIINSKKQQHVGKVVTIGGTQFPRPRIASLIRAKILRVLEQTGLTAQRANKCDETDFLRLLYAFNQEGIRFS